MPTVTFVLRRGERVELAPTTTSAHEALALTLDVLAPTGGSLRSAVPGRDQRPDGADEPTNPRTTRTDPVLRPPVDVSRDTAEVAPLPAPAPDQPFSLADIYNARIEKLAAEAYQRDYVTFGFSRWA